MSEAVVVRVNKLITLQLDENLKARWKWNCPLCDQLERVAKRSLAEKHLRDHLKQDHPTT